MTLDVLRQRVQSVEPAALLVEPRILRRVIRLDRRLPGYGLTVPHRKSYAIERDRLLAFVDRAELELPLGLDLPRTVILLSTPEDDSALEATSFESVLHRYARLLFHASVHVALDQRLAEEPALDALAAERRRQIGAIEFAEIRSVLLKDDFLFPSPEDLETYVEFAAVYLELRYFAPHELSLYFPGIRDWGAIDEIVSRDVDHAYLYEKLRPFDDAPPLAVPGDDEALALFAAQQAAARTTLTLVEFRRYQASAERAALLGNSIKAAIAHTRAARRAPAGYADEAYAAARNELRRLVTRLQAVLELSAGEAESWNAALEPLLTPAAEGFWSNEARLLYDLQKVCVEHERGVYRLDLMDWIRTWGERPVRRPLPILREALVIRHLRTAQRRVALARVTHEERERLASLLAILAPQVEQRARNRLRPIIVGVLDEVELIPQNVPESVARRKLVEELLDRVVEHSYLNMAHLRDALSKNELKLPDVLSFGDLVTGDRLLQADRKLDGALDGVYRRGAVYQRWPQTLSSLAFGTSFGRFLTQHLAIPFGGAYLTLEFLRHVAHFFSGEKHHDAHDLLPHDLLPLEPVHAAEPAQWEFYGFVLILGMWLYLLIHRPEFRAWNLAVLQRGYRLGRKVLVEVPARIVHSQLMQRIVNSQTYAAVKSYLLRPALVTGLIWLPPYLAGTPWSDRSTFELFLVVVLFLNSPIGRTVTEITTDFLMRSWHELRMRVLAAAFQRVMAIFHNLALALERVVYTVDEWLRFRSGDSRLSQTVKLVTGVIWFFVAYVVVFVFTLLVEPQVNPIKHFPVVTVAHKLILPTGPVFVRQLSPLIGKAQANTLVWTTIWLIPGVFGFLVWELKENWRLYAANRSRTLRPISIGGHGETMTQLLRPGFHSGTLPKAYSALRRAARKQERVGHDLRPSRKHVVLHHAEVALRRFIERELLRLLEETNFLPAAKMRIGEIRLATNRIDVELLIAGAPQEPALLTWEDDGGVLTGAVIQGGWLDQLSEQQHAVFLQALAGLFQRAGVEHSRGARAVVVSPRITWEDWVALWSEPQHSDAMSGQPRLRDDRSSLPIA